MPVPAVKTMLEKLPAPNWTVVQMPLRTFGTQTVRTLLPLETCS